MLFGHGAFFKFDHYPGEALMAGRLIHSVDRGVTSITDVGPDSELVSVYAHNDGVMCRYRNFTGTVDQLVRHLRMRFADDRKRYFFYLEMIKGMADRISCS
ncbi:hypothetical protein BTH42_10270 [Burkholderia sp. SRS-W-2-2016]|nr:hypothetical protein BTH42_10270 [Burkholderia sp. SRS-W-2-2016]